MDLARGQGNAQSRISDTQLYTTVESEKKKKFYAVVKKYFIPFYCARNTSIGCHLKRNPN